MQRVIFCLVSLLFCIMIYSQTISVGPTPETISRQSAPFSAFAYADIPVSSEELHKRYTNNTSQIEDNHFDEKVVVQQGKDFFEYQLIFTHWFAGTLFRLNELHTKYSNISISQLESFYTAQNTASDCNHSLYLFHALSGNFSGWVIHKTLMKNTKNSWVGDKFSDMDMFIIFAKIASNYTRVYVQIAISADERRTVSAAQQEARNAVENIMQLR